MIKRMLKQRNKNRKNKEAQALSSGTAHKLLNSLLYLVLVVSIFLFAYFIKLNFIGVVVLLCMFFYVKMQRRLEKQGKYNLLHITLLFVIFLAISDFIVKQKIPFFYIPFSLIPMLATIIFSSLEISLMLSLASGIILALLTGNNLYLGLTALISGIVSSILVIGVRRRSQIIRAGFFVGLVQIICLFFIEFLKVSDPQVYLVYLANGFICGIIVAGILPIFEYLFGVVTNISLLELSDFNHPLLRSMILKAAGTYHHSLVVGNLAEQACEEIGANSLLARIGSYYHDIGKIEKADYFSENQPQPSDDKHAELAPSMSKLVIMNHVKEGAELARQYKLNPRIIDFILHHHGTSLVYYFYRRALESSEQEEKIEEEGFRYPGPKPSSKEEAIVLLADSTEAACRAIKTPSHEKIKEVVHKIVNNKFIDGQLDECDLTLRDLERIALVFIKVLGAIYHPRVSYPDKESANNNTKSAKANSHHSAEDKENGV